MVMSFQNREERHVYRSWVSKINAHPSDEVWFRSNFPAEGMKTIQVKKTIIIIPVEGIVLHLLVIPKGTATSGWAGVVSGKRTPGQQPGCLAQGACCFGGARGVSSPGHVGVGWGGTTSPSIERRKLQITT